MMVSEFGPNRLELQEAGGNKEETFIVVTVIVFLLALSHCWHSKQTACASRTEFFGNCFFFFCVTAGADASAGPRQGTNAGQHDGA